MKKYGVEIEKDENYDPSKMKSKAEIINHYVKELLSSGKRYHMSYIKKYVRERTGENFSAGAYSGALRYLVIRDTNITSPRRGFYQLVNSDSFVDSAISVYEDNIKKINNVADTVSMLNMNLEQEKVMNILRDTNNYLKQSLSQLKDISNININDKQ